MHFLWPLRLIHKLLVVLLDETLIESLHDSEMIGNSTTLIFLEVRIMEFGKSWNLHFSDYVF